MHLTTKNGYITSTLAMTVGDKHTLSQTYKIQLYFQSNVFLYGIDLLQLTNSQGQIQIPLSLSSESLSWLIMTFFLPVISRSS